MARREIKRMFRSHMIWGLYTLIREWKGGLPEGVTSALRSEG